MQLWAIIKLSWKNVWRSPVRSSVVVVSVVLAIWSGIFLLSFINGMTMQFVRDQLENYTANIQIHNPEFLDEKLPQHVITESDSIIQFLQSKPYVHAVTARSIVNGLASSATNNFGVAITGINPETEPHVRSIDTFITEGNYLEDPSRNPVLVGTELARRLSLSLRSRVVLTFQDVEGNITAGAFRVAGIFRTPNTAFNENTVFVRKDDINRLLGMDEAVHEIAILIEDFTLADQTARELSEEIDGSIQSWGDLSPMLRYIDSSMAMSMYIMMSIIIIALCFGIVNTMLMAVLERTQELGMLRAIGVNKRRSFAMIMFETLFITMIGAPLGLLLSWMSIYWMGSVGIDLSAFSQGLEMYGYSSMVYPELDGSYYINITLLMFFAALFAAVFPALKALKLNPVEAIRKI